MTTPETRTGYVGQCQWSPPEDPAWFDATPLLDTSEAALTRLHESDEWFKRRRQQDDETQVSASIVARRIVKRTITDVDIANPRKDDNANNTDTLACG